MKTREKPFTTAELFDLIIENLRAEGKVPEHIDYAIATRELRKIEDYAFDVCGEVNYGDSEGVYVDLICKGNIYAAAKFGNYELGTIKTLRKDDDAFRDMALLMANFQIYATRFINHNLDDFTWSGYDIRFYEFGQPDPRFAVTMKGRYTLQAMVDYAERTMKRSPKCERAVIVDNAANKVVHVVWSQEKCPHCLDGLCSLASDDMDCNGSPEARAECAYCK